MQSLRKLDVTSLYNIDAILDASAIHVQLRQYCELHTVTPKAHNVFLQWINAL